MSILTRSASEGETVRTPSLALRVGIDLPHDFMDIPPQSGGDGVASGPVPDLQDVRTQPGKEPVP